MKGRLFDINPLRVTRRASALWGLTLFDFREGILGSFKTCIVMCTLTVMTISSAYPRHQLWYSVRRFIHTCLCLVMKNRAT